MGKRFLAVVLMTLVSCSLISCYTNSPNQTGGTLLGGAAGGLIGSTVGAGTGQAVAVGVGAVAGALIGGAIGHSMDETDRVRAQTAIYQGQRTYWVNERTHYSYTIVPMQRVRVRGYNYCRRFKTAMMRHGDETVFYSTACRLPDGAWYRVGY